MTNGVIPRSAGIDTADAMWVGGFSHTKDWIFVDTQIGSVKSHVNKHMNSLCKLSLVILP